MRQQLGDAAGKATVLHNMGLTAYIAGDYAQAIAWLHESIAADPISDPLQAWAHIGIIALDMLDVSQARSWLERAHERVMQGTDAWGQAFVLHNLADALRAAGDMAAAKEMASASLRRFEALGDSYYLPDPQLLLAQIAADEGDCAAALAFAAQALTYYEARQDAVRHCLRAADAGRDRPGSWARPDQAAALADQAHALRRTSRRPLTPREEARYAAALRHIG